MEPLASEPRLYALRQGVDEIGFVAIDSTIGGRARGGLRLLVDVGAEELQDAARTMTLKYGFLGLPQGGAKAGLKADPESPLEARHERLRAFAGAALPLLKERRYVPDADMGTRASDIRWMMQAAGLPVGPREWRSDGSGVYTAASCLAAARAALLRRGRALAGCRVAIEGFGQVGSALASLLHAAGASIVAVSTSRGALHAPSGLDIPRLVALAAEAGSTVVERCPGVERLAREALLELPVDVLCPCARRHSIHVGNAARVAASVLCAGANDAVAPDAERELWRRGVAVPPDFIANCGGVLGGTLEFAGVAPGRARRLIERVVEPAVTHLLARSEREGKAPRALAEPHALARHERVRRAAERPGLSGRVLALGVDWYRRGWLPGALVGAVAPAYLERRLDA